MARFADVSLDYADGAITCDPDIVRLAYEDPKGKDAVRWKIGPGMRGKGRRVELKWKTSCPFDSITRPAGRHEILGGDNIRVPGLYRYTVALYEDGKEIAQLDPGIQNDPWG